MKKLRYRGNSEKTLNRLPDRAKERFATQILMVRRGVRLQFGRSVKQWKQPTTVEVIELVHAASRLFFTDSYPDCVFVLHVIVSRSAPKARQHRKVDRETIELRTKALLQEMRVP